MYISYTKHSVLKSPLYKCSERKRRYSRVLLWRNTPFRLRRFCIMRMLFAHMLAPVRYCSRACMLIKPRMKTNLELYGCYIIRWFQSFHHIEAGTQILHVYWWWLLSNLMVPSSIYILYKVSTNFHSKKKNSAPVA